jgi:heme exporter protein A
MSAARLAFDQVACLRGDRLLFEGMGFALDTGDAALVTGPNGSGKSSLLRLVAGLLKPAAGAISRVGSIAYLGEQAALDTNLPLVRALDYWAGIDRANTNAIDQALAAMGISALAEVPVRMLSTGQRRRAGLARVVLSGAEIWLLDEPGNGLDAETLGRLGDIIAGHRADGGIVLAATHQPLGITEAIQLELLA